MMKPLVVDASLIFRLVVPGPQSAQLRLLATQWREADYTFHAPSLWLYEVTSAVCKSVYAGALTEAEGRRALALAQALGVVTAIPDETQVSLAFDWTRRLNCAAAYDSFYLALAEALHCDLWTADRRLQGAVDLPWLHCVAGA